MYTATCLGGGLKSETTHAWKIFQGKVNIWNEMWTCKWKVTDSIGKGVNKTVNEGLQTKWLDGQIPVENVLRQLQIVQIQHTYVISSQKN
jgi:hypothetical protein